MREKRAWIVPAGGLTDDKFLVVGGGLQRRDAESGSEGWNFKKAMDTCTTWYVIGQ